MTKKQSLIGLVISIILFIVGVGITFAAYTYTRQGTTNSKQIVGDIYMHYTESNALTLSNAMPSSTYIANSYFQFTIDGKNTTTNKDIYFDISLVHGDVPTGKTEENRIEDQFLKFRLVEVVNSTETELIASNSYDNLTNKRIYVDTVPKNTISEISHTYRIYMWIGDEVGIGTNTDYTMSEWGDLFASIKVNVTGDFEWKEVATDENCFYTQLTIADPVLNNNLTNEELQVCVSYLNEIINHNWDNGGTSETFCQGIGTIYGYTFQDLLDGDTNYAPFEPNELIYLKNHNIIIGEESIKIIDYDANCGKEVIIPSKLPITSYTLNSNLTNEELQTCINYLNDLGYSWNSGETAEAYCQGLGTLSGYTFQQSLDYYIFSSSDVNYLEDHNIISKNLSSRKYDVKKMFISGAFCSNGGIGEGCSWGKITELVIPNSVTSFEVGAFYGNGISKIQLPNSITSIPDYTFSWNQLTSIEIPNSVTMIGNYAFSGNKLTSIEVSNGVTTIGDGAFEYNYLTNVSIPNNVTKIGERAFYANNLLRITIGNEITEIGNKAFSKSNFNDSLYVDNPNLTSISINKSCSDIKNNMKFNNINYYPWLSAESPYTASGVTIYGANNEVCDTF